MLHETQFPAMLGVFGFLKEAWEFDDAEDRSYGMLPSTEQWQQLLKKAGFQICMFQEHVSGSLIILARKVDAKLTPVVFDCNGFLHNDVIFNNLQTEIENLSADPQKRLWLKAKIDDQIGLLGLVKCLRLEPNGDKIRLFLYDDEKQADEIQSTVLKLDLVQNILKDGSLGAFLQSPLEKSEKISSAYWELGQKREGDLTSFILRQSKTKPGIKNPKNGFRVSYVALNFRDVLRSNGVIKYPRRTIESQFDCGIEYSGFDAQGLSAMLVDPIGGFLNYLIANTKLSTSKPAAWTMAESATVPVAYYTAYLALVISAKISRGNSVLIHSGSGGVGLAAIRVAHFRGCEVYTTVGSDEKRAFLLNHFPFLTENHIGNSRSGSFEKWIMQQTNYQGVDCVINSLSGELMEAGLRVVKKFGHFVEIGKRDIQENKRISLHKFLDAISYHALSVDQDVIDNSANLNDIIHLFKEGLHSGEVQPLPHTVFDIENIEKAMRYMAAGKHIGKVLLKIGEENFTAHQHERKSVLSSFVINNEGVYVITGGLGGFGFELISWLAEKGAKNILVSSRGGVKNNYQHYKLALLARHGVNVNISCADITSESGVANLMSEAKSMSNTISGIFHLAMILDDGLFVNQTKDSFMRVLNPKFLAATYLDEYTRRHIPDLDYFVVFSSAAVWRGSPGQSNYCYANAAIDALCRKRASDGLPALSIQWGPIGDVGFVHRNQHIKDDLYANMAINEQRLASCLLSLERFLAEGKHPVVSSVVLLQHNNSTHNIRENDESELSLIEHTLRILGYDDVSSLNFDVPLSTLGFDSLMQIELRQLIEKRVEKEFSPEKLMALTLKELEKLDLHTPVVKTKKVSFNVNYYK